MRHFIALLTLIFWIGGNAVAQPAAFPTKPLRLVVPNAAGGGTDAFARVVAAKLGDQLGQSVIVENKPGAQGGIGTAFGAKSAPDGHTMTLAFTSTFAVNPFVHKDLGYDPLKDFAGVALGVTQPYLIVTYPDAPYNSLQEFADFARKKTGGATFASTSSQTELIGVLFQTIVKTKMLYIPYKNATTAVVELSRGDIDVMVASLPSAIPLVKAGKLKALAVTGNKRVEALPDVKGAAESGFPEFEAKGWYGIAVPAATPQAVIQKLNQHINLVLAMPDVKASLVAAGFDIETSTPEGFTALIKQDYQRWGAVAKQQRSVQP